MKLFSLLNLSPFPDIVQVEVAAFFQLPSFHIIGLPNREVAEAKDRVRSAIEASGMSFPRKKVILNLSPAFLHKKGTGIDLAMALSILGMNEDLSYEIFAWAELGLNGELKPVGQMTRALYAAWKNRSTLFLFASAELPNAISALNEIQECGAFSFPPPRILGVSTLCEAWDKIRNLHRTPAEHLFEPSLPSPTSCELKSPPPLIPLSPSLERQVGVAASGHHHILLLGPKGTGKSHALEWLIQIRPAPTGIDRLISTLTNELYLSSNKTHLEGPLWIRRISSFARPSALLGSFRSSQYNPGEYSMAHGGILVADELPEWNRDSRESLREPLERGVVSINRTTGAAQLPAKFLLASTGNFCPCGKWPPELPLPERLTFTSNPDSLRCRCNEHVRKSYLSKLVGPVLDRIDLVSPFFDIPSSEELESQKIGAQLLEALKEKVFKTQTSLKKTWGTLPGLLNGAQLERLLSQNESWKSHLKQVPFYSLRSRHKTIRLAMTLACWDEADQLEQHHFLEASCYRIEQFL